jgi:peptidoglycan hydrolase-like protein with peptidoglycan-binding domain
VVLVVVVVIIVAVVATGGGGGSPTAVPTTTASTLPVTPPANTPNPSNNNTTTTTSTNSLNVTIPAGGNLSAGDSGDQVLTLQKALKQLGLDVGTPDGKFGQKTQDAVKAFQTAHSLTPDGVVGSDTAQAINDALASSTG